MSAAGCRRRAAKDAWPIIAIVVAWGCTSGCTSGGTSPSRGIAASAVEAANFAMPGLPVVSDATRDERILALDPENISAAQVREMLAAAPAPRIVALQGSVTFVTMEPLAQFLVAMGYPEARLRNPADGSLSYSSFADSARLAGVLAWHYEREGMMPMLIGHSQGGMLAIRVLHELAGEFHSSIDVWNPLEDRDEGRAWITDPVDGKRRDVIGLKVGFASALATGKLPRIFLGQWSMLGKLRQIPDSVVDFTGVIILWDPIAGTFPGGEPYRAQGSANVRNVELPAGTSHIGLPDMRTLGRDPATRAAIDAYRPVADGSASALEGVVVDEPGKLVAAAELWYGVKKHWCLEAQRVIRARRAHAASTPR
ncbi:MAG: hypothetical protein ABI981_06145 [Betaproteobacteria bacterium]